MAKRNITIDVDFAKKDILKKFSVKQFDNAKITINTFLNNVVYNPTGNTCKLFIGIDNDLFLQEKDIQVQENKIIIDLDKNMISKSGMAYAELELKDSNGVMTSVTFIFTVEEKLGEGANIPGNIEGFVELYERLIKEFKANVDSTVKDCNTRVDNKLIQLQKDYDTTKNTTIKSIEDKTDTVISNVNKAIASGTQDLEVKEARDGELSLRARLDRDKQVLSARMSDIDEVIAYDYSSENNYINIKNSKEGTLDNVRIEGKTLVNLINPSEVYLNGAETAIYYKNDCKIATNGEFVAYNFSSHVLTLSMNKVSNNDWVKANYLQPNSSTILDIGSDEYVYQVVGEFAEGWTKSDLEKLPKSLVLLKETVNLNTYFEGLKSVGELEELEITSCNNGNLFDRRNEYHDTSTPSKVWWIIPIHDSLNRLMWSSEVTINYIEYYQCTSTDAKKLYSNWTVLGTLSNSQKGEIKIKDVNVHGDTLIIATDIPRITDLNIFDNLVVSKGTTTNPYIPHESDKKKAIYKDSDGTWKPVVLRKWDYIEELSDGRCKYHRNSFTHTITSITGKYDLHENNLYCYTSLLDNISKNEDYLPICNKLKGEDVYRNDKEGISVYKGDGNLLRFNILKSKLTDLTIKSVNDYLSENNFEVVGKLAQEEVYDCIDLSLNSFDGETSVFTNSSIPHRLSVTQKQGLKARVETLEQEMRFMYDNFNYALKQVLAGDMQSLAYMLYPQDFENDIDSNNTNEDIPNVIPEL